MKFNNFKEQLAHFNQDLPAIPDENAEQAKYLAAVYGLEISGNYLTNIKNYRRDRLKPAAKPQGKKRRFRNNEPEMPVLRQGAQDVAIALAKSNKPLTIKDLANKLGKAQSGIGQILQRLCDRKLATMTPKWKSKFFTLTEAGRKFAEEARA